jgi:hypothetical protein
VLTLVRRSKGNKQVDKNVAKENSFDSIKHKKKAQENITSLLGRFFVFILKSICSGLGTRTL